MDPTLGAGTCLQRAVDTLRDDPIGMLLPAGGALLLDAILVLLARHLWPSDWTQLGSALALFALCWLVRSVLQTVLRSRMVAAGARAAGMAAAAWGRPMALLGVELVVAPLVVLAAALFGLPLAAASVALASHGWFTTAAFLLAFALGVSLLVGMVVRAVFALAPAEVIVGGRSALHALGSSARFGPSELGGRLLLVMAGDLLVSLGGLSCGAGGLPGYPITDVAMLHRWRGQKL